MTSARPPATQGRPAVILASASAGRLAVLRGAGIEPTVLVSGIDEDAIRSAYPPADSVGLVRALALAKAEAVVAAHGAELADAVVIAADSMLLAGGELQGKPHTAAAAQARWASQLGQVATLLTGHAVLRVVRGAVAGRASATARAEIHLGAPTPAELAAYVSSGEPLAVAGGFTIDGLGGWFVEGIVGDPSCVIGLSLPTVRRLLVEVGIVVTDLWNRASPLAR